ncbi:LOW QUALITY PROTEIN: hypothetical protein NC653_030339 [Populus alba x Populus x berolinensis]|uniref:Uncharacterized protein n=1 Tax=Populus alba x Populus x berolinensis TaxID=444605 RepID=A0AAD6LWX0_9ROSI|nr:LOW QUALITY PROTEIN: hypothetical protein NC653_030339 [Populus alba x Populus x berolinensis]
MNILLGAHLSLLNEYYEYSLLVVMERLNDAISLAGYFILPSLLETSICCSPPGLQDYTVETGIAENMICLIRSWRLSMLNLLYGSSCLCCIFLALHVPTATSLKG